MNKNVHKNIVNLFVIVAYICSVFMVFLGVFTLIGAILGTDLLIYMASGSYLQYLFLSDHAGYLSFIFSSIALAITGLGIFLFITAKALSEYKEWGRISIICLAILEFGASLFLLPIGFVAIVIDLLIIYFFGINKTIKRLYKK